MIGLMKICLLIVLMVLCSLLYWGYYNTESLAVKTQYNCYFNVVEGLNSCLISTEHTTMARVLSRFV